MDRAFRALMVLALFLAIGGLTNYLLQERVKDKHIKIAFIANAVATAIPIKLRVQEYYAMNDELPSSNEMLNLRPPEGFKGNGLHSIAVEQGGVIHLRFGKDEQSISGNIFLIPDSINDQFYGEWLCLTPNYQTIEKWIPQCRYQPVGG